MTVPVTAAMEFCLLGSLAVRSGGVTIPVSAGKQRAVLAALLLDAGRAGPAQARARHDEALAVASQVDDRYQQARAHAGTCADAGDPGAAARHWQQAYAGFADLGVPEADGIRGRLEELAMAGRRSDAAGH